MRVVGCFLQYNDTFLILLRHSQKPDGNTWGLPGGKVEAGESDSQAVLRELYEETGYQATEQDLEKLGEFQFVSLRGEPYTYPTFRVKTLQLPSVALEDAAHTEYQWVSTNECLAKQNLISDLDTLLELVGYTRPVVS
jgi:8-oxo-dGTP diphosphatase